MFSTILSAGPRMGTLSMAASGALAAAGVFAGSAGLALAGFVAVPSLASSPGDAPAGCGGAGAASPFEPTSSSK